MYFSSASVRLSRALPGLLLLAVSGSTLAGAPDTTAGTGINIGGNITATGHCAFSKKNIAADFGDIRLRQTDHGPVPDGAYRIPVDSVMTCTGDTEGYPRMRLMADASRTGALKHERLLAVALADGTRSPTLAVRLLKDGKVQDVNTWFPVDLRNPPRLEAELVATGSAMGENPAGVAEGKGASVMADATLTMDFDSGGMNTPTDQTGDDVTLRLTGQIMAE